MLYEVLQEVPAKLSPGKHSEEVDAFSARRQRYRILDTSSLN